MAYRHGVYVSEKDTGLVTPVNCDSALPFIVGVAPVHNLPESVTPPVNEPKLVYNMDEFVKTFGAPAENETASEYGLYQAASVYFERYHVAPVVFVNVFDPSRHVDEEGSPDPEKVQAEDIIGKVESRTLKRTGLSLLHEVYPRYRLTPGLVLAPGFSSIPAVAIAIGAVCDGISGCFRALGIIECPPDLENYTKAPEWLNDNNLADSNLICMFGNLKYNGQIESGSVHLAGVIAKRDSENDDIPFWSPSNSRFYAEAITHNGEELFLTMENAAYLNGNGIVTGLNMIGGLVAWGDQTACYPGITDIKDSSIPIRRMFAWIGNTLILTAWQFVSNPIRRRMIETVQDTFNVWLNGLTAREYILGGRVVFENADNPTTDLMDGKIRFHVYVTPPQAAREIDFILEYDPEYLQTLFAVE